MYTHLDPAIQSSDAQDTQAEHRQRPGESRQLFEYYRQKTFENSLKE
jgi:hypothetical protein